MVSCNSTSWTTRAASKFADE
ncbi:unnamed protein product [Acanthoscelides obtectus]|uniref:Uncharacterized protein n=1 Tax=Acanthoscelides obtectus TaxID=200917 RepID=A0A9P0KFK5_ACAOB|nr:unnamed protein product [Acanthoscelides obtectus]CAK1633504.1 hypothetical protein AOBTE_LOCUS8178 [Acanthoscelides obtectus]